ncbi:acyltransferase family protein [Aeromicrobium chenweiae]|uniref:Pyridoxal-5'-phosphate-dependent protein subunit beta n=1 Tax=Aeromicrobium chenweiae TaxID=2079793 RepID=A0A2S0WMW5_9ACTN|nr:acyltransferase family protein [Aeromicrobium chenweiae]AWB92610.1 pyridoxal-5'-phosphate-dependent protein subunit beta [Aeromicrobium chenweiae]TGN33598.1 acyltransferase [Aeromicrobium chenweiae]
MPDLRTPRPRETWPDVAKGVCILLVVLWHVVAKHYQQVDWDTSLPVSGAWGTLGEQLLTLRMPLFFTVSGLFAVSAVGRPWRVLARTRVAKFGYLYVVWLLIHTAVLTQAPSFDTARARGVGELVEELTISPTNLWYLLALALYFVVARVTRRVPTAWLLAAAFLLSAVAAAHLVPVPGNRGQVLQNLAFFLAGLRLRPAIEAYARTTTTPRAGLAALAYAVALGLMALLGAQRWFGVWPLVSVLATACGVAAAVLASRHLPRTTRALGGLGTRTLPIYVMHLPLLAVLDRLLDGPLRALEPRVTVLAVVEPALLTAVLVGVCLLLHRVLLRAHLTALFALPSRRGSRTGSTLGA